MICWLIFANDAMQKYKICPLTAIGTYPSRTKSICFSVSSAIFCFSLISRETSLLSFNALMADSSSKILPVDVAKICKILSSHSFAKAAFFAPRATRLFFLLLSLDALPARRKIIAGLVNRLELS